jgi:hypothetical protein
MADALSQDHLSDDDEVSPCGEPTSCSPPKPDRPCKTFSCSVDVGVNIEATVWGREIRIASRLVTVYSVTFRKNYKTDDGWGQTAILRGNEIPVAVHVLQLAATWIMTQRTQEDQPPS